MTRVACLTSFVLLLGACSDDGTMGPDTGIISSGGTAGDGDGDEGSNFEPVPARGITLTQVTANHAVNVPIAENGEWVGPTERIGRLSSGRDTLFRIYYTLDENWVEREIEARLSYEVGGEVHEFKTSKVVVVDSSDSYLEGTMWFALPADGGYTAPDAKFQVSLWEVEPGGEALEEHVNVAPTSGREIVGFENIPMKMKVNFVPFTFNGRTPDTGDTAKMDAITKEIYQTEPIQELETAIDDLRTQGAQSNVCNMLTLMSQLWSAAGAPSDIYFVGLVDTGASSGIMGCALLNAMFNADVWVNNNIGTTATSIVHEIGHNQGLRHVQCNDMGNPAADPDTSYPDHPLGRTLNTGFGIRDFSMYPGDTTTDYMSYCNKRWVSPWTWSKVWTRIKTITEQGSGFVVDPTPVMHVGLWSDGTTTFWTALDYLTRERVPAGGAWVEFVDDGEVIAREPAIIDVLTDDVSLWVTVPMPNGEAEAEFDMVRYTDPDGEVYEAVRDEVSFYTRLDEAGPQ